MHRFSPVAPAQIRVLVLPVVQIERRRFLDLLARLKAEASIIELAHVQPHAGEDEHVLHPRLFPHGCLLYNYTTSTPSEQHLHLSPFELFREPLLVLGIIDEVGSDAEQTAKAAAEYLRERHPRVVHRQILALGGEDTQDVEGVVRIGEADSASPLALQEALHRVSASFLRELATYTKAMQASPGVQTPGQTARTLQRTNSLRDQEREHASGYSTPTRSSDAISPVDDSTPKSLPLNRTSPPTSFDQIAGMSGGALSRSDSRASNRSNRNKNTRASSQDRVSVQGFGSGTSQEKLKSRGKARVGIVLGSLYMMAGQWGQALRMLTEHTSKVRVLGDHIWHGKGLEISLVCMLLHAWAGVDFQIPSICYPIAERMASGHSQRFSITMPSDFRTAEAAQNATIHRLWSLVPDLSKLIVSLTDSGEGSLELPFLVVAEIAIRFCNLLNVLRLEGALGQKALRQIVGADPPSDFPDTQSADSTTPKSLSKNLIIELLLHIQLGGGETLSVADHVAILSGTATVYGSLGMNRKKAMAMREVVQILSHAIGQARRRGAAEMGIHPAATLSAEVGADAVLAGADAGGGRAQMLADFAAVYGVQFSQSGDGAVDTLASNDFGNESLKLEVLTQLAAFCEALPDLNGILHVHTSLLGLFGPCGAVDAEPISKAVSLTKEEQIRLASTISRTVGVAKTLGLTNARANYWDPFLVRGVEFASPDPAYDILDGSKLNRDATTIEQKTPGNPLLYDPNAATRPGTAGGKQQISLLVLGEVRECVVLLQNPYEVALEIESCGFVTDGAELEVLHQPIVLNPMRIQRVSLSVLPRSIGDCKITGCRVKLINCAEQVFPIVTQPWTPLVTRTIKGIGQEARFAQDTIKPGSSPTKVEHATVLATVISSQPCLEFQNTNLLEENLMLLDGEKHDVDITIHNSSETPASLVDIVTSNKALRSKSALSGQESIIEPGKSLTLPFQLVGQPSVSTVQAAFYYRSSSTAVEPAKHVRVVSVSIGMTVNAAVQIQRLEIMNIGASGVEDDSLCLSFDIGNAWPKVLSFTCSFALPDPLQDETVRKQGGALAPAQFQRVFLSLSRLAIESLYETGTEDIQKSLLERVHLKWNCEDRAGEVDMSSLRFTPESRDLLQRAPVFLDLKLDDTHSSRERSSSGKPAVKVGSFATIRAKIAGFAAVDSPLLIQLRSPSADTTTSDNGLDRRVAISGPLRRVVRLQASGQENQVDFAICPLAAGELELVATVRPALMSNNSKEKSWSVRRSIVLHVV